MIERIKFRGKAARRIENFNNGKSVSTEKGTWIFSNDRSLSRFFGMLESGLIDPATVGQWTGLKDCDGTEIYENDKVEYNLGNDDGDCPDGIIEFWDGQYYIEKDGNLLTIDDTTDVKVIGTIHDKAAG